MNVSYRARLHLDLQRLLVLVGVCGLWALVARYEVFAARSDFPTPGDVFAALLDLWDEGELLSAARTTTVATLQSFVVATVVGVGLGTAVALSRVFGRLIGPVVEFLRPMPSAALVPVGVVIFGIGSEMKLFIATYAAVWPVLLTTSGAIRGTDRLPSDSLRLFGYGRGATVFKALLPGALPVIMTGLRIAMFVSLALVVTAEILVSGDGLGSLIVRNQLAGRADRVYAAIVAVMVVGVTTTALVSAMEWRLIGWHRRMVTSTGAL